MMPVYRFMDPYNGTHNHKYHPNLENFQSHLKADSAMPPMSYEMPYANNLGYPVMPTHSCCNPAYLPSHCGWRNSPPAYSYPPLNHFHCCGQHYPAFPQSYPAHYAPPSHYTMNIPNYDFDKMVHGDHGDHGYHCCGCSNHVHNMRSSENVKVEEQEAYDERRNSNSLIPVNQVKNNSYPIVWIPPDYLKERELSRSDRSSRVNEKPVREIKPAEIERLNPSVSDPRAHNVGVPFDLKNFGRLGRDSDGKKSQKDQDEKEKLPFPLIWIPYYDNKNNKEEVKKVEDTASATSHFNGSPKSTSVKQIEEPKMGAHPEETMKTDLKHQDNAVADKLSGTNAKGQFSSAAKTSKLPPVCLRVDPLPKKKNGKVASRSPSPPGTKDRQEAHRNQSLEHKESPTQKNNGNMEGKKKEGKVIPVVEKKSSESEPQTTVTPITDSQRKITTEKQNEEVRKIPVADEESKTKEGAEIPSSDKAVSGRKELSDVEAALRIQSAYRGFTVRRWEPLKKLKEIAKVRDKVAEVRHQIQTLESSFDPQKDGRQKLIIGETIMSLLLKLDTIQGLHPSFRDMRKSLARELVTLQDKLDTFLVEKPEEINETKAIVNLAIDSNVETIESDAATNHTSNGVISKDENNTFEQEARSLPSPDELPIRKQEEDIARVGAVENPSTKFVPSECEAEASEKSESAETCAITPNISDGKGRFEDFEDADSTDILSDLKELPQAVIVEEATEQEGAGATDAEEPPLVTESLIANDNLIPTRNTAELSLENELPLGLMIEQDSVEDEMTKLKENEGSYGDEAIDFPVSELPVAILDEDEPQKEEGSELQNEDSGRNHRHEVKSIENVKEDDFVDLSEHQSTELSTKPDVLSVAESEKADGKTGHEGNEGDVQHRDVVDVSDIRRDVEATELTGREQSPSDNQDGSNDELCGEEGSHKSHISDAAYTNLEDDDEQTKDDINVLHQTNDDVKMWVKQQVEASAENSSDANETVVSSIEYEERDQEAQVLPTPAADSQLSIKEHDVTDKRVLEEKEQLKEMVEKLLKAGKEQMNVISSLTARMNELEKNISRKKKARPARLKVSPWPRGRQ